jgi:hypothetical protein
MKALFIKKIYYTTSYVDVNSENSSNTQPTGLMMKFRRQHVMYISQWFKLGGGKLVSNSGLNTRQGQNRVNGLMGP